MIACLITGQKKITAFPLHLPLEAISNAKRAESQASGCSKLNRGAVSGCNFLHLVSCFSSIRCWAFTGHVALEHLLVGFPEVLREKGVDDGVDRGVAVGQAMSCHTEKEGRLVQRERSKLHPEMYHMMWKPGQAEDHHHHQDSLCSLWTRKWKMKDRTSSHISHII